MKKKLYLLAFLLWLIPWQGTSQSWPSFDPAQELNYKQRLDSLVHYIWYSMIGDWYAYNKTEYTYDDQRRLVHYQYYEWHIQQNIWINNSKEEFVYDALGNLAIHTGWAWNGQEQAWYGSWNNLYEYAQGKLHSLIVQEWDFNATGWVNYEKYEYTYGPEDLPVKLEQFEWLSDNSSWEPDRITEYIYDGEGQLILDLMQAWGGGQWWDILKNEYTYDEHGNLLTRTYIQWESDSSQWVPEYLITYTYNEQDLTLSYTGHQYNMETGTWIKDDKAEYIYDANGDPVTEFFYLGNEQNEWRIAGKWEMEYDGARNRTLETSFSWNEEGGDYAPASKRAYLFDPAYAPDELILPGHPYFRAEHFAHGKMTDELYFLWNSAANDWKNTDKYTYFFTTLPGEGLFEAEAGELLVYPNPADDRVFIDLPAGQMLVPAGVVCHILDSQGRLISTVKMGLDRSIPLSGLPQGMYYLEILSGDKSFTARLYKR
jgi:hypothetical protein